MVTVTEIKKWMRKLEIKGVSDVTTLNKEKYLKVVYVELVKREKQGKIFKRAKIIIEEELGHQFADSFIVIDKSKSIVKREQIDPGTDIAQRVRGLNLGKEIVEPVKGNVKIRMPDKSGSLTIKVDE